MELKKYILFLAMSVCIIISLTLYVASAYNIISNDNYTYVSTQPINSINNTILLTNNITQTNYVTNNITNNISNIFNYTDYMVSWSKYLLTNGSSTYIDFNETELNNTISLRSGFTTINKNTTTNLNVTVYGTITTSDQITVNYNPNTPLSAGLTGTGIRVNGGDNTTHRIAITSYGTGGTNAFAGRHARGNNTNPTSVSTNDVIASFEGFGRVNSSVWSGIPHAYMRFYASNLWNVTYRPTHIEFYVTNEYSIIPFKILRLQNNGLVNVTNNLSVDDTATINNLIINGNVSIKRPYGMYSSNVTQNITAIDTPQKVLFEVVEDNYLINKVNNSIFQVLQQGDYLVELSAIAQSSATGKRIQIWVQKNNVNIPRSNTIYDFKGIGSNTVLSIPFIIDLTTSDNFSIMIAGDSTGIQLPYIANTSYSPSTPPIIMTISKISEITD